mmetsp:Transcript_99852/g.251849  ORF Transcript_99852/g.251849 Transcript_99852/m.251849 type:complete len:306 (+) Transcript_99852:250-1167(+)
MNKPVLGVQKAFCESWKVTDIALVNSTGGRRRGGSLFSLDKGSELFCNLRFKSKAYCHSRPLKTGDPAVIRAERADFKSLEGMRIGSIVPSKMTSKPSPPIPVEPYDSMVPWVLSFLARRTRSPTRSADMLRGTASSPSQSPSASAKSVTSSLAAGAKTTATSPSMTSLSKMSSCSSMGISPSLYCADFRGSSAPISERARRTRRTASLARCRTYPKVPARSMSAHEANGAQACWSPSTFSIPFTICSRLWTSSKQLLISSRIASKRAAACTARFTKRGNNRAKVAGICGRSHSGLDSMTLDATR